MGTRHLTVVVKDQEYKIAQYGQWDGYPSGAGQNIVSFLLNEYNPELFEEQLNKVHFLTKNELEKIYTGIGEFMTQEECDKIYAKYPALSRDVGSDILSLVQNGETNLKNMIEFASDSLFCEYAYVVNLDNDTLEIYKGFNTRKLAKSQRFYTATKNDSGYYPIRLHRTIPISELTENTMEIIENEME